MSLTLEILLNQQQSPLPVSAATALTIFAPPDSAFSISGQPSLSLLLLHLSPVTLSIQSLRSLPFSSTIPTLASTPLYITTSASKSEISINNVKIIGSPLYDDGSVIVFAVDDFVNPNFTLINKEGDPNPVPECPDLGKFSRYNEASRILKSRGYTIIASFLELQFMGYLGSESLPEMKFTMLAPSDEVLVGFSGNFLEYKTLFFSHLLPCKLSWSQLNEIQNQTVIGNSVQGFSMNITRSDNNVVMVNGVKISSPNMYEDDSIVVHGIQEIIALPQSSEEDEGDKKSPEDDDVVKNVEPEAPSPNYGEF